MSSAQISAPAPPLKSPDRIISIDVLKGIAIALVILAHIAGLSFVPEEQWIYGLIYTILDVFGPSMFIFLSVLGVVFSILNKPGGTRNKKTRNAVFQRGLIIFLLGSIVNILGTVQQFGPLSFWQWFILQLLAFSQIITFYVLKLPKLTRMILAFLIIFIISPVVFGQLTDAMYAAGINYKTLSLDDLSNPSALLFWFLYYPPHMSPILPWIAVPFIASIVGESLVNAVRKGTREAKMNFIRATLVDGIIFVLVAIAFGSTLQKTDLGTYLFDIINNNPYFQIPGIPEFLIMHSNYNLLYNMGMSMILLCPVFYLTEVKNLRGRKLNFFNFYGRFSLSLFMYHMLFGAWLPLMVTLPWMVVYMLFMYALLYYFLKMLVVKFEGVGTIEWLAAKMARAGPASKNFYETQIRGFKEGFEKISKKVKGLLRPESPVENPVEAYIYDALAEHEKGDVKKDSKEKPDNGKE